MLFFRAVEVLLTNIDRMFPEMSITITRPCASNVVLLVILFQYLFSTSQIKQNNIISL